MRPQEFGFYGTQWRRWPGQGVMPVAAVKEATPTLPPKSAVPGPDEESRGPRAGELPAPEPDAVAPFPEVPLDPNPTATEVPSAEEPAPLPSVEPARPAVPVEPKGEPVAPAPPAAERPAAEPAEPPAAEPAKKPSADNLFDESATGPVRRRFVARRPAAEEASAAPVVRPATLTYPASAEQHLPPPPDGWKSRVPRVPFDPAAEAARLRR